FEVEHGVAIDQHEVRTGGALERPAVVVVTARPGQGRAIRVGRIGGGEHEDVSRLVVATGVAALAAQPVEGGRQAELGATQSLHEVAAPDSAALLPPAPDSALRSPR